MDIKFLRVLGIRSKNAAVLAKVNGHLVEWTARSDFDCDCLTDADEYECDHITIIRGLLDDRVLEGEQ